MNRFFRGMLCLPLIALVHCAAPEREDEPAETADEGLSVHRDDLNGLWITHVGVGASAVTRESVLSAWPAVGVRLDLDGKGFALTHSVSRLTASWPPVSLTSHPNGSDFGDDVIDGTIDGQTVRLERDVAPKPPIVLPLPGDRPFRSFLVDQLAPAAQRDRESYATMHATDVSTFLHGCVAWNQGYWQYKYMAGADRAEESASIEAIVTAVDGVTTSPRALIHEPKFADAVKANVRAAFLASYAVSDLGLYFSTAAGRSLHIPMTSDTTIYFITDRPDREEKLGLVLTESPLHGRLATTFGGQLFELGSMASSDDAVYVRSMMDLLARSDVTRVSQLSAAGRAAIADWYGVMAIEDYRGVAFGHPSLGWGYNFTNAQFYGLVARALGQVIVGKELRPGNPSYADVLNDGKDMQEYPDMAALKQLATAYLIDYHSSAVADVLDAFAGVVPASALDTRAKYDVFHYVCAQLFDDQGRTALLGAQAAKNAVAAVGELVDILFQESAQLEAYILASGFTKSSVRAPKRTGVF